MLTAYTPYNLLVTQGNIKPNATEKSKSKSKLKAFALEMCFRAQLEKMGNHSGI